MRHNENSYVMCRRSFEKEGSLRRGRGEHPESLVEKGRILVRCLEVSSLPFRHRADLRSYTQYIHRCLSCTKEGHARYSAYQRIARLKRQMFVVLTVRLRRIKEARRNPMSPKGGTAQDYRAESQDITPNKRDSL